MGTSTMKFRDTVSRFRFCVAESDLRPEALRDHIGKRSLRDFETGPGFAGAKLSEILPAARVARFVRMTKTAFSLLSSKDLEGHYWEFSERDRELDSSEWKLPSGIKI